MPTRQVSDGVTCAPHRGVWPPGTYPPLHHQKKPRQLCMAELHFVQGSRKESVREARSPDSQRSRNSARPSRRKRTSETITMRRRRASAASKPGRGASSASSVNASPRSRQRSSPGWYTCLLSSSGPAQRVGVAPRCCCNKAEGQIRRVRKVAAEITAVRDQLPGDTERHRRQSHSR
jgi:hypothetical protein